MFTFMAFYPRLEHFCAYIETLNSVDLIFVMDAFLAIFANISQYLTVFALAQRRTSSSTTKVYCWNPLR